MASSSSYTARLDTHPGRPGFLVEFRHPRVLDKAGKYGRKLRRGLGTSDPKEAKTVVDNLNDLLSDENLHDQSARKLAKSKYHPKAIEIFYNAVIRTEDLGKKRRDKDLPLPESNSPYEKLALVGLTSAGKTTLLRLLSGSDHTKDRFPATSGSRTTTFPLEMVVQEGPYKAALSFLRENEVYLGLEETIVRAVKKALQGAEDAAILEELLMPIEDGLRLKYLLGTSVENQSASIATFVLNIRDIASSTKTQVELELGEGPLETMRKDDQAAAMDLIESAAEESPQTDILVATIMEELRDRTRTECQGNISRTATGWPRTWTLEMPATRRAQFLTEVKRFVGNSRDQFGRLLTPLVSGLRVSGPFFPKLFDSRHPLIFCDTVGFGHYTSSDGETPEYTLEQLEQSDKILLVESAKGAFANADLHRLIESIATSGQTSKLIIAMTHLDLLAGDDVDTLEEQREKALLGLRVALGDSIRKRIGADGVRQLTAHLESNLFFLSNLNNDVPGDATVTELKKLYEKLAEPKPGAVTVNAFPTYEWSLLTLAIRDAIESFRERWQALLGLRPKSEVSALSWQAQKAMARRYSEGWDDRYPHRPASSLHAILAIEIARLLDNPISWMGTPTQGDKDACINKIKHELSQPLRKLCVKVVRSMPKPQWIEAWAFRGRHSTISRRDKIEAILTQQVPFLRSSADSTQLELFRLITEEVMSSVTRARESLIAIKQPT